MSFRHADESGRTKSATIAKGETVDIAELLAKPTRQHQNKTIKAVMEQLSLSGVYDVDTLLSMDQETLARLTGFSKKQLIVMENILLANGLSMLMQQEEKSSRGIHMLKQEQLQSFLFCPTCDEIRGECRCKSRNQWIKHCHYCNNPSHACGCEESKTDRFYWEQLLFDRYHGIITDDV